MTDHNFDIQILALRRIKDVDGPTDLCVHGQVFVKIGDEVVAGKDTNPASCRVKTVSPVAPVA